MAGFTGNGTFQRFYSWIADKAAGVKISYNRMDDEDGAISDGLSRVLVKDGQQQATGPISFAVGLKLSDGTAAAPAASFISDTDTGLYRIGANNLGIAAGGAKVLDFATATVSAAAALALGTALAAASGGTGSPGSGFVRLWRSTEYSFSNNFAGGIELQFDTVVNDPDGLVEATASATYITIARAGTYLIVANVEFTDGGSDPGTTVEASIIKNFGGSAEYLATEKQPHITATTRGFNVSAIARLVASDTINLEVARNQLANPADSTALFSSDDGRYTPILSLIRISD